MKAHPHVKHPRKSADAPTTMLEKINNWVTEHLALALGSMIGIYLAFIIPLMALGIPLLFKLCVLIFSSWIQSWGLFCLQRSANRADVRRAAKEDADHEALTHIANIVDRIEAKVDGTRQQ
jgi:hypothetical protein